MEKKVFQNKIETNFMEYSIDVNKLPNVLWKQRKEIIFE